MSIFEARSVYDDERQMTAYHRRPVSTQRSDSFIVFHDIRRRFRCPYISESLSYGINQS